ncbi:MAG: DNA-directed RNA polymerase subunit alpha [Candidatus Taylorbacteria bacterium RIFCSPHIGHO2_02_FULL_45_28]|uniref:DNA-directed RNA polymerase subunit alpha n=1 Tax=Candidatus Taylorbacteria bacterium RIFCSPHIGHO2_12_FULL_45_16 TaxID=1802315 RepID=A0A1G2MZF0_9BACT|nr:MAG: DNA-directed RNA polymerase subunit alpha [Candidatus Taylorbacteria bacterium RIFCSPHIGHO2_01_FULL_44_110]OHA25553.1 MAG: DNA-directed RNA polymerase subunit alpha [Candidatus Taylorbacteria bacterium RIFCSPHIGHO2_02_FULL_45_28]OHA29220.1 MAG: DNA-directed RNA polymerase subunit alpha [Candidatus Taylorbacteria bacterium RIFCSPHIGHO2_12_FULL_45_16]OHA33442.1 MAG: DNA-directed RNA polymerase subunit alpha [Candidatus Taylorbacteria bacterium RIFCSPLOWO2_01_FULL_45_59]OHA39227.1 MAG: DNA
MTHDLILPSKPRIINEHGTSGTYEIDGLYPGYGHTLGNSLRRIILSSLPGAAVTKVKIKNVEHEFSAIDGIKEDVITILLALKKLRVRISGDEAVNLTIKVKGAKEVTAKDIDVPGQVEILNPELHIASLTEKSSELDVEIMVEKGLGYVSKEIIQKERVEIGAITLDAAFTPIRKANYEVENMRVGDRTDFNRLRVTIETDGTISPREALEKSIAIMIHQLKAIVGFTEKDTEVDMVESVDKKTESPEGSLKDINSDLLKTRVDALGFSVRTAKALSNSNVRTLGGLARKKESDIMDIDGLGAKGMQEIKKLLAQHGITLKQ